MERAAVTLVTLVALGEAAVGVALLVFPTAVARLLIDANLDPRGVLVARMFAVALIVLGLTWWMARRDTRLVQPGLLVYNVGVGLLFGWAALGASLPILPWAICALHLAAALAMVVLGTRGSVS